MSICEHDNYESGCVICSPKQMKSELKKIKVELSIYELKGIALLLIQAGDSKLGDRLLSEINQ